MGLRVRHHLSSSSAHFCLFVIFIFLCFPFYDAQNATTDPSEVRALNLLLGGWDAQAVALWNISGEPCSGSAINATDFKDGDNNPAIKCDCSYNNNNTCHITQLRVYALQKRGTIPEVIVALKYLTLLNIDQNYFTGPLPAYIGNLSSLKTLTATGFKENPPFWLDASAAVGEVIPAASAAGWSDCVDSNSNSLINSVVRATQEL